ncbi:MAG TPA: thioredoxin domain-containing protein [Bryobacteraceae bacterium]|nr:thioredoxin domain-containing protein [Bryobacteraceae bacterium]
MTRSLWLLASALAVYGAEPPAAPPDTPPESVRIVVYSDFQCPFCRQFSQPFRQLMTEGVDGLRTDFEFKNFPLSFHPNAQLAAQAVLAAKEQGKFWEMHDLLFANQSALKRENLLQYAQQLGLDMNRFRQDLDSDRIKQAIDRDKADGTKAKVEATPTIFINGKQYTGSRPFTELKKLVAGDHLRRRSISEIPDRMLSKGAADAKVTLEFFADLQSPVSRPAVEVLEELLRRYPDSVRIQFRNFPLVFHPQAELAHEAAMTGARDGHFWDFAAYLLDHQDSLREQDLIAYAGRLGLDQSQFAEAMRKHRYAPRIDADLVQGQERGLRGSPVIFVNHKRIDGVPALQELTGYVEAELAATK